MCNLSEAVSESATKCTQRATIIRMFEKGKAIDEIEDLTGYPLELIEEVKAELED